MKTEKGNIVQSGPFQGFSYSFCKDQPNPKHYSEAGKLCSVDIFGKVSEIFLSDRDLNGLSDQELNTFVLSLSSFELDRLEEFIHQREVSAGACDIP